MIEINKEQREIIRQIMPDIDERLSSGYDEFMDEFYDAIIMTFKNDEPTEISYELEKIYDEIVYNNRLKKGTR